MFSPTNDFKHKKHTWTKQLNFLMIKEISIASPLRETLIRKEKFDLRALMTTLKSTLSEVKLSTCFDPHFKAQVHFKGIFDNTKQQKKRDNTVLTCRQPTSH